MWRIANGPRDACDHVALFDRARAGSHTAQCSRAITPAASIVTIAASAARPMSRRLFDEEAIVSTPSMGAAGRDAFASPHVRQLLESAPARVTARVHVVARVNENRMRDDGPHRLGGASHRLLVWTHHPRQGAAGKPVVAFREPVSSQWFTGGKFSWSTQRFPPTTRLFS
jgi:hypothetical protein